MSKDPLTEALDQSANAVEDVIGELGTIVVEYGVELVLGAALVALYGGIYFATSRSFVIAGVYTFIFCIVFLGIGRKMEEFNPRFRFLRRVLDTSRVRRGWYRAVKHCGFKHPIPVNGVERVSAGYRARVRVGRGISFKDLEMRKEPLAASMAIRELRIRKDPHNASTGTVTFVSNDVLEDIGGTSWPGAHEAPPRRRGPRPNFHRPTDEPPRSYYVRPKKPSPNGGGGSQGSSLWDPIPIGTGEHGESVTLSLVERSALIGGIPGSGKSAAMSMMLARAALDPNVHIYLIDGKEVELHTWEGSAEEAAYTIEEAIALLKIVQRRLTERLKELRRENLRKVQRDRGMALYAVFIDELALFTANPDSKLSKEFTNLLTDVLARGRAAGIIVCAATQKPEGTVVSTNLRDLFAYRLALRCSTPEASDTILGRGYANQGFNAQTIPPGSPGVGFLLAEDGVPQKIRTYYLTDDEIRQYADQAYQGRQ